MTAITETCCGTPKNQAVSQSFNYVVHPIDTIEINIRIGINTDSGVNVFMSYLIIFSRRFVYMFLWSVTISPPDGSVLEIS